MHAFWKQLCDDGSDGEFKSTDFGGKSLSQELIGKPGSFISVVLSLYWCVRFILYSREYMFIDLTF